MGTDTHKWRTPREGEGRDWGNASKPPKAQRDGLDRSAPTTLRKTNCANALLSDF